MGSLTKAAIDYNIANVSLSNPTAEIIQHVIEYKLKYTYSDKKSLKIPIIIR
jgi:hypothetical protein